MKKLFVILIGILLSLISFGQDNKKEQPIIPPPDSISIVALRDINLFYKYIQENLSHADYLKLTPEQTLNLFYRWAVIEWDKKKKKKP